MDTISIVISSLLSIALVLFIAPSIIRMNRGNILRNMALWLAILLALALFYKLFGPFNQDRFMRRSTVESSSSADTNASSNEEQDAEILPPADSAIDGGENSGEQEEGNDTGTYNPPRE